MPTADDLVIRPPRPGEAAELTELAMRSKAHWGYDADFMAVLRPILTISEADLVASPVSVLDAGETAVGWYRLTGAPPSGELEDLWLDPAAIGHGRGRMLFEHALRTASKLGFDELRIEADPNAEGFYAAMGATCIGERLSPSGRTLPLMRVASR